jgi:hypothetical protein
MGFHERAGIANRTSPHPPPFSDIGRHDAAVAASHDEAARLTFIGGIYRALAKLAPGNRAAYLHRVSPALEREFGRPPQDRDEVHRGMRRDPFWQMWSAIRRNNVEYRQNVGRTMVLRQLDDVNRRIRALNARAPHRLKLDPSLAIPRYVSEVDNHCMPGSYHTELGPDDAFAGANYDFGLFLSTGGNFGPYCDGAGMALARWIKNNLPDFKPPVALR